MTRVRLLPALALLALLFAVTACSDTTAPAVSVNGTEVSDSAVQDEIEGLVDYANARPDDEFAQQVLGQGDDTVSTEFTAQVITERVVALVVADEFEDRGLSLTQDERDAAETQFVQQLGQGDEEQGRAFFEDFPEEFQEFEITFNAQAAKLSEELAAEEGADGEVTDEEVRAFYDDNPDQFAQNCVSHILVDDEETASSLREEIEGGADFATVAEENSTDTGSGAQGGELGCAPPGSYVPEFEAAVADAEIDEVTEPVESEFGFHLILVTDRSPVPFDEAEPQIRAQLESDAQDPLTVFLQEALREADVDVNPKYGEWDAEAQQVIPPEGPESPTTTAGIPDPAGAVPPSTTP